MPDSTASQLTKLQPTLLPANLSRNMSRSLLTHDLLAAPARLSLEWLSLVCLSHDHQVLMHPGERAIPENCGETATGLQWQTCS